LFLIIQMIILLDFTQSWNDAWVANGEDDPRWLYALLGLTVTAFLGVLGISGGGFFGRSQAHADCFATLLAALLELM
jgi:hypothetical protein